MSGVEQEILCREVNRRYYAFLLLYFCSLKDVYSRIPTDTLDYNILEVTCSYNPITDSRVCCSLEDYSSCTLTDTAISIKVVRSAQAYATRPKGSVGSCKSDLV